MTQDRTPIVEGRARELLAAEYEADGKMTEARGLREGALVDPVSANAHKQRAIRAIVRALSIAGGE